MPLRQPEMFVDKTNIKKFVCQFSFFHKNPKNRMAYLWWFYGCYSKLKDAIEQLIVMEQLFEFHTSIQVKTPSKSKREKSWERKKEEVKVK